MTFVYFSSCYTTTTSKHQCPRRAALNLALLGWLKDEDRGKRSHINLALLGWLKDEDRGKRSHINVAQATNFKDLI